MGGEGSGPAPAAPGWRPPWAPPSLPRPAGAPSAQEPTAAGPGVVGRTGAAPVGWRAVQTAVQAREGARSTGAPSPSRWRRAAGRVRDLTRRAAGRLGPLWATRSGTAAALGLLTLASLGLRLEGQRVWFWIDEGLSAGIAGHRLSAIPGLLRQDGSPPLYYLLLHGWIRAFGDGEVALHAFSLVFALACVPAAWWAGASLFGRRTGWIAALLAATNPFLTYYGREARMYTLVAFEAIVAVAAFLHVYARGRRRYLPLFVAALTLLLYTHNWGLFWVAGAGLALVPCWVLRRRERRALVADAAVGFGLSAALFAPWLPTLAYQVRHTGAPWSRVPELREAISEVGAVLGDERVLVALLLVGGAGLARALGRDAADRSRQTVAVVALVTLFVTPLALSWITSQFTPNWATRYFAMIVGAALLLAAAGLARAGRQGIAALVLILLFWTHPLGRLTGLREPPPLAQKSNVKAVAATFAPRLAPGDLVVVTHPEQVPVVRYYLGPRFTYATPMGVVADPTVFDWRDVYDRLAATSVARDLRPLVDRLPVGAHLVLLGPVGQTSKFDARTPRWFRLFFTRNAQWVAALEADPRLRLDLRVGYQTMDAAGTSLYGLLFTKTAP